MRLARRWRYVRSVRNDRGCARVAAALVAAKQAVSDDVRQADEANARAHAGDGTRRELRPVSSGAGNTNRWVGRSWGL
jgi:hypothetical protein